MLITLINPEEIEQANRLKHITSPNLFTRNGVPDENGLLSNTIFGMSPIERRSTYAIIQLNHYMITPHIYKILSQSFQIIPKIIAGLVNVSLDKDKHIIQDPNGSTGIEWLYDNWEKINFTTPSVSSRKDEKLKLLKNLDKHQIWIDRILVIPAGFREVSPSEGKGVTSSELNNIYINIIRSASQVSDASQLSFTGHKNLTILQNRLIELYDYCKSKIEKKGGYIKQALFSKTTDFAVRSVISCGVYNQQSLDLQPVKYPQCELALSQVLVGFLPFVKKYLFDFFNRNILNFIDTQIPQGIKLYNPSSEYSPDKIDKMIDNFIRYPETRFKPLTIKTIDKEKRIDTYGMQFTGKPALNLHTDNTIYNRPFTYTDIMFIAASDVSKNKHCVVTRYPILTYLNTIIQEIVVGSTIKTIPMILNSIVYNNYPCVDVTLDPEEVPSKFIETARFSNSLLGPMGADFDGDQTTVKCLWSVEANAEAHKIIYSKNQFVGFDGETLKKIDNEAIQTLYMMTMDPVA